MDMVIQRELQVLSRRRVTYWGRFIAAGIAIFIMWQSSLVVNTGRDLFQAAAVLGFASCILDGLHRGAASIAEETAEGTIGFLLLTPLSGERLLLGKYGSVMIGSLPLALAVTPIVAVAFLLGGVSGSEFARAALALIHTLSIAVAVAVIMSGGSRSSTTALVATLAVLAFGFFMFGVLSIPRIFRPLNPLTPILAIGEPKITWAQILCSVMISQAATFAYLTVKGRDFPKDWRQAEEREIRYANYRPPLESTPQPKSEVAMPATPANTWSKKPELLDQNPIEWLTVREMGMQTGPWVFIVAAACCASFAFLTPVGIFYSVVLTLGLVIFQCIASARTFAVARQSGGLELLVTTPLGVKGVIAGHLRGLRKMFFWPAVIMTSTFAIITLRAFWQNNAAILLVYPIAGLFLLFLATSWIGMWMGLKCKTANRASLATIGLVLIVPRVGFCWAIDAPYFLIMGLVARQCVYGYFEKLFSDRDHF